MHGDSAADWLLLVLLGALASCSRAPQRLEAKTAPPPAQRASSAFAWHYRARLEAGGELFVEGHFDGKTDGEFLADPELAPFVHQLESAERDGWRAIAKSDTSWVVPCVDGCGIRYRFALRDAAETLAQADTVIAAGDVLISPPSTWLLHPGIAIPTAKFELSVEPGPNGRFLSAFQPVEGATPYHYQAPVAVLDDASYAAFGPLQTAELSFGSATVQLGVAPYRLDLSAEQAKAWVKTSAGAVASYYQGQLPAQRTLLLLMQGGGASTRGITLGGGGPSVLVRAPERVTPSTAREDWVVTHELLHANFPDVGPAHLWLSEGLATYLEPIIRSRAGLLDAAKVWGDMVEGMPQGLPAAGDEGLENTRTWGRTYWGGAIFCLLADVEIREKTGNRRSLDDVLLAIGKTGANDEDYWPIERVLEMAERATGTQVLGELYERLGKKPTTVDLDQLFARLGVRVRGETVVFDESAPLAGLRRSITARPAG